MREATKFAGHQIKSTNLQHYRGHETLDSPENFA